jgi:hypothetical protein
VRCPRGSGSPGACRGATEAQRRKSREAPQVRRGARSLCLEIQEWKWRATNLTPARLPAAAPPESRFEASKRLIYGENQNFSTRRGVTPLIHNLDRVTLWTTRIFPDGSNALVIGYFLRNFLAKLFFSRRQSRPRNGSRISEIPTRSPDSSAEGARGTDGTAPRAMRRRAARYDRPVWGTVTCKVRANSSAGPK